MSIAIGNDIIATDLAALATLANAKLAPGTPYAFGSSSSDWLTQLNRIRTDFYAKIFTDATSPIYRSPAALVSDPQCVGINPCPQTLSNGKLYLQSATAGGTLAFPLFREIGFLYAVVDADFTMGNQDISFDIPYLDFSTTAVKMYWGVSIVDQAVGTWDWNINSGISGTGSAPNLTLSGTFNWTAPVACTLWVKIKIPLTAGGYDETHSVVQNVTAGTGSINWTATGDYSGLPIFTAIEFFWPADTTTAAATAIHPGSTAEQISATDIDWSTFEGFAFSVTGRITTNSAYSPFLTLNLPSLRGMWLAKTLPTPALNTFLDSDFPPYVQNIVLSEFTLDDWVLPVSVGKDLSYLENDPGNTELTLNPRSSLRQPSPSLPHKTLGFLFSTPSLANGANYSISFLFPDDVTLQVYGGPGNTGADPLLVLDHVLPIYVSRTPNIDPTNPATYGFKTTTGQVDFADVRAHYDGSTDALTADGRKLYFLIHNDSGANIPVLTVIWEDYTAFLIRPVEPGIFSQPAVWPVMRDTDDYPWYGGLDGWRTLNQRAASTLANLGTSTDIVDIPDRNIKDFKYAAGNGALYVYAWITGASPTPPAYGSNVLLKTNGVVTWADLIGKFGNIAAGTFVNFMVYNPTGNTQPITISSRFEFFDSKGRFQPLPIFFPSVGKELDPVDQAAGVCEAFPNSLVLSVTGYDTDTGQPPLIPQRGYVVYSVLVRRQPKLTVTATAKKPSIYLPPTADADLQELAVKIGFFSGLTHTDFEAIDKGVFHELTTITIPHGELEARVDVFWPVLYGTMLVYQSDAPVFVELLVNFQPIFHGRQYSQGWYPSRRDADPSANYLTSSGPYQNYFRKLQAAWPGDVHTPWYTQFPIAAVVITDLTTALNLL